MDDPRPKLLENLNLDKIRIEFSESPIVLLCGGLVPTESVGQQTPALSLREILIRAHPDFEIFRPEEITDWQMDAMFQDLVDFEKRLSGFSSLVVVILESPGSIAELGTFSQLGALSKKLVVIVRDDYLDGINNLSFINLGILRYLKEQNSGSVKSYPWSVNFRKDGSVASTVIDASVLEDLQKDIKEELAELDQSQVLSPESESHIFVLVHQLIKLFLALKESEILSYLKHFGVDVSKAHLRKIFFLLERFQTIRVERYSDADFYVVTERDFHGVRWSVKSTYGAKVFDELRFSVLLREYYSGSESTLERHRLAALKKCGLGEGL